MFWLCGGTGWECEGGGKREREMNDDMVVKRGGNRKEENDESHTRHICFFRIAVKTRRGSNQKRIEEKRYANRIRNGK